MQQSTRDGKGATIQRSLHAACKKTSSVAAAATGEKGNKKGILSLTCGVEYS